ncbi:MAG: hypothetical protein EXQ86_08350 [Rhodospirillales bacterium]|nr:hypothetical protein [Rhodospirillales bacterium]
MPSCPRTDLAVAGVTLAFCAATYGLTYRFDEVPAALMSGLGPELFPRLVIGSMALFAGLIALGLGGAPTAAPAPAPPMAWMTGAALVAFMGGVEIVGMWPAAFVFLVGLGRLWGERSLVKLAAAAIALCLALYLLFVRLLGGSFPKGIIAGLWS